MSRTPHEPRTMPVWPDPGMQPATPSSPPPPQPWRALRWLALELRSAIVLSLVVALFFKLAFQGRFWVSLVFALCIGVSIQMLVHLGRYGLPALARRLRPGSALAQEPDWPGWLWMAPWTLLSAAIGYYFGATLAARLLGLQDYRHRLDHDGGMLGAVLVITLFIAVGVTYFYYSRARLVQADARAEAARRAAAETQLRLLESQLEPHMLFNTLSNLRVLIGLDPERAQRMLDHLIAFLRATLAASRSGMHSLGDEWTRLQDYLALMAVRMGPRLQVRLQLPDELRGLPVPPLLLQPLVENGIQHGLEPQREGGRIEVTARRDGDMLELAVRDTGAGLPPGAGAAGADTGFGLVQVRERLRTLYGERASLTLEDAGDAEGGTRATVRLPLAAVAG